MNTQKSEKNNIGFSQKQRSRENYQEKNAKPDSGFEEKVIQVDRVSRTVKGGKRMRFRALVAIGNRNGRVGIGIGKAQDVLGAVKKAVNNAKKDLVDVPIKNGTIQHDLNIEYGSAKIILRPARPGTSIIAGSSVRVILELSGIKNILSKILGSNNKINNAKATIIGLKSLKNFDFENSDVKPKEVHHEAAKNSKTE